MREGAYADDHMVIQNLSGQQLRTGQRLRDSQIVEDIVKSYLASGASMSEEKRVRFKETGTVWGSLIRWARRLVGTALDRRHQTGCLIFDPVALGHVDLRTLDSILGAFHHPFRRSERVPQESTFGRLAFKMERCTSSLATSATS